MPPTPTKQSPPKPPVTTSAARPGSILGSARPVAEARGKTISTLIYGRNRIGKTTWACQFPKPLLLISMENTESGGAESVSKIPGVQWLRVDDTATLIGAAAELSAGGHGFKSVVVDGPTALEQIVLMELMGWDKPAELLRVGKSSPVGTDNYVERSERMRKLLRPFFDLSGRMDVVMVCNEKDHNPAENRKNAFAKEMQQGSYFSAACGAGTALWLMNGSGYIVQMTMDSEKEVQEIELIAGQPKQRVEIETGRLVRRLRLGYHPNYAAGARADYIEGKPLPDFIDGRTPKELYENFRKAIQ